MQSLDNVHIHPISEKLVSKGHYWIIEDSFTKKFPDKEKLNAINKKGEYLFTFLHDSQHRKIKGRLWSKEPHKPFLKDVKARIKNAIKKRKIDKRENFYLVFGEADQLPGLFIQEFNQVLFIQYKMNLWKKYEKEITSVFRNEIIFRQDRKSKNTPWECLKGQELTEHHFHEFNINYKLNLKDPDLGFYTDMSAIREKLQNEFENAETCLNLYSYTGAFSLYALKNDCDVTSVDLSRKYLNSLERNLELNEFNNNHETFKGDVLEFLEKNQRDFDLVICDPPSSSNNKSKQTNALKNYEIILPLIAKKSERIVIFLNTHQVTRAKFRNKIQSIIKDNQLNLKIEKEIFLSEDCSPLKGFPESDYLKGFVLKSF